MCWSRSMSSSWGWAAAKPRRASVTTLSTALMSFFMALTLPRHGPAWGASDTGDLAPCTSVQVAAALSGQMRAAAAGGPSQRAAPAASPPRPAQRERRHHPAWASPAEILGTIWGGPFSRHHRVDYGQDRGMDLSVVAVVATIAAGVSILVAVAAVFAARRSTAHADLALKEASRISRASISRINEVQSEASSARLAARHAAERLRSMTKERTTPDSVAAYRVFLREVVEDSKHLLGPEGTGTMKNEALDRLRVGALVGGSDEVLRAMRNFALLRTQRPEAPWPSAYAMAYARLESDLVTAIRNDLGSSEESLTADQIWGAVNARCVDPAFRLALLSPLEDVLRNAGQDPTHYDLDHIAKFADYPSPASPAGATRASGVTGATRAVPSTDGARASGSEPQRRSRRARNRVERRASEAPSRPAAAPVSDADVVWPPITPGRQGGRAAAPARSMTIPEPARPVVPAAPATTTATTGSHAPVPEQSFSAAALGEQPGGAEPSDAAAAVSILEPRTDAPSGPSTDSLPEAPPQAAGAQSAPPEQTSAPEGQPQHSPAGPRSHREPQAPRRVFEDPTPSRISRRRRTQAALSGSSMQAAAAPDAITVTGTVTTSPLSASVAATSGASTASANTEETEPVLASTPPGTQTGRHTTEAPASPIAAAAATGAAPARPQPAQPTQPRPSTPAPRRTRRPSARSGHQ
ncbi:hypothetical protein HMPREF0059_02336 [Actinomyces viscosus C505]|uniref:Uncharacterized protein n=2 Tax=Actinomyces viscosus TaxID=1656 RepID=F2V0X5_ACTVI|nr:hypothetical protein HMPREF0059_02336 [Actinomyces viscosus C505]